MTTNTCDDATGTGGGRERPWLEYREQADGLWLEREFDTVAQAEAWAHEHLGNDVVDVGRVHDPELVPAAWAQAGYATAASVAEWIEIGIGTPVLAQEWIGAGFTPESASAWCEIEGMSPSRAMSAVNNGVAPIDIERVRRADPDWQRSVSDEVAAPDMGPWL